MRRISKGDGMPRPYGGEPDVVVMNAATMLSSLCAGRRGSLPLRQKGGLAGREG